MDHTWQDVPRLVVGLYKDAAAAALEVVAAHPATAAAIYWEPLSNTVADHPAGPTHILVKRAAEDFLRPVGDVVAGAQRPLGGPNPLTASIVGGLMGAGLGYGGGWLAEQLLPERHFEPGRLRRTGAIVGGLAGTLPGIGWGAVNWKNPGKTGGGLRSLVSPWPFKSASEVPAWFAKAASVGDLYAPHVPVADFNAALWQDAVRPYRRRPWGDDDYDATRLYQTPPWAAAAASGIVAGAGAARDARAVSPWDVAVTAAATAGKGYLAGLAFGKTLGFLAGLRPEAQQVLQDVGLWGGLVTGAVKELFGGQGGARYD